MLFLSFSQSGCIVPNCLIQPPVLVFPHWDFHFFQTTRASSDIIIFIDFLQGDCPLLKDTGHLSEKYPNAISPSYTLGLNHPIYFSYLQKTLYDWSVPGLIFYWQLCYFAWMSSADNHWSELQKVEDLYVICLSRALEIYLYMWLHKYP